MTTIGRLTRMLCTGGGGGGGSRRIRTRWGALNTKSCGPASNSSTDNAAMNILNSLATASVQSGLEYGAVIFVGPDGGTYYSSGFTSNQEEWIDFGSIAANAPAGYTAVGYVHVHPERYPGDASEVDPTTENHFSVGDEEVAQTQGVNAYVLVGGPNDVFEWNSTNTSLQASDRKVGNISQWSNKC